MSYNDLKKKAEEYRDVPEPPKGYTKGQRKAALIAVVFFVVLILGLIVCLFTGADRGTIMTFLFLLMFIPFLYWVFIMTLRALDILKNWYREKS